MLFTKLLQGVFELFLHRGIIGGLGLSFRQLLIALGDPLFEFLDLLANQGQSLAGGEVPILGVGPCFGQFIRQSLDFCFRVGRGLPGLFQFRLQPRRRIDRLGLLQTLFPLGLALPPLGFAQFPLVLARLPLGLFPLQGLLGGLLGGF